MRDGTSIPIREMTDSHLVAAVRMIEREHHKSDLFRYVYVGIAGVRYDLMQLDSNLPNRPYAVAYRALRCETFVRKIDTDTYRAPALKTDGHRIHARLTDVEPWDGHRDDPTT